MQQSYEWKKGAFEFRSIDPKIAYDELERIRTEKGTLTPAFVVDAARAPESPLHEAFPWDDAEAARIGREQVASRLIRSIRVIVVPAEKSAPIDTKAFTSVPDKSRGGDRSYIATTIALESEEGRAVILRQALLELRALRRKYSALSELSQVFDLIDQLKPTGT